MAVNKSMLVLMCCVPSLLFAESKLLLQYKFDDKTAAVDSSGRGLDGIYQQIRFEKTVLKLAPGVSGKPDDFAFNGASAAAMGTNSTGEAAWRVKYSGSGFDASYASFTVCGWFKTDKSEPFSASARLLTAVGTENLLLSESGGKGLRLQIGDCTPVDSGKDSYSKTREWTFFAVTYDSTASEDNVKFWEGGTDGLVLVCSKKLQKADAWKGLGPAADVSIGNRHGTIEGKHLNRPFDGYIDDFRIYGDESSAAGALTEQELNKVRSSVLDPTVG
jgi:hypothetical protein